MTGQEIYDFFKVELDGEDFQSEDDAILAMNVSYRKILSDRPWGFLEASFSAPIGSVDCSGQEDFDELIRVWADHGGQKDLLSRAPSREDRFDTSFDYYYDRKTKTIHLINDLPATCTGLIVDYKSTPEDITLETSPAFPVNYHSLLAYQMAMTFKEADSSRDFYSDMQRKYDELYDNMLINDNA